MPDLEWKLVVTGPDTAPIKSFQQVIDALKASGAAAAQSLSGIGTAAGGLQAALNPAQMANAATGLINVGKQLDSLQRQFTDLSRTRPTLQADTNFQAITAQITALQTRLEELQRQPITLQTRDETAQLRTALAQLQRDAAAFRGELPPIEQELANVGAAGKEHIGGLASFFENALSAATGFLAADVFRNITDGLKELGSSALEQAGSFEQSQIAFTAMLDGNRQAADALLAKLQAFSNITPFHFQDLQASARELLAMGTPVDEIMPKLQAIATAVAAVGGGAQQINTVTQALAKMDAEGKVSAIFMNELTRDGVPAWRMLAEAMGVSVTQVRALATAGDISAATFDRAFNDYTVKHFGQALEQESQTFQGLLTTVGDLAQQFERTFGGPLIAAIEPTLQRIVSSLQDPNVIVTLQQWGQATGQFVNGLIQAGTVAFQVAGQILGALKPVTDAIGQIFGIQGGPAITVPSFQPAVLQSAQLASNTTAAATQAKTVKEQIAELERQQRESNRAAADQQTIYTHQKDAISEQIRLLQEKYDMENAASSRAALVAKIQKDEALAVDVVSSQGQAAAQRLVQERDQLRQMDRKSAFDAQKGALEDQQRAIEAHAQKDREATAATQRAAQARIDALRAGADTANTITGQAGAGPSRPIAGDNIADRYAPASAPAQVGALQTALDGLRKMISDLLGGPAGLGALKDTWDKWIGSLAPAGTAIGQIASDLGTLTHTLGLDAGLNLALRNTKLAFSELFSFVLSFAPVMADITGGAFKLIGDQVHTFVQLAIASIAQVKALAGQGSPDDAQKALVTALVSFQQTQTDAANFGQSVRADIATGAARFAALSQGNVNSYVQAGAGNYSLPVQGGGKDINVNIKVGVDQNGRLVTQQHLDQTFTSRKVDQLLGDAWSNGH